MEEEATHLPQITASLRLSDMLAYMVYHSDRQRANKYLPVMGKQGTAKPIPLFLWVSETDTEAHAKPAGGIE